jgi:pyruvate formate lyase activating enzyme
MQSGEIVSAAFRENSAAIAYTYSEPLIHAEFLLDCMAEAHRRGVANVLVTNGCINTAAAKELFAHTGAANIDLKSFSAETYANVLGGNLETVLDCIRLAVSMGVHVEITTLVVPGLNDSKQELGRCADFIAALPGNIPWHLSAYHPDYRWNAQATDPALLLNIAERAREQLRYVYTGNIADGEQGRRFCDTVCFHCGAVLVRRSGYRVDTAGLAIPAAGANRFRCAACGGETDIRA